MIGVAETSKWSNKKAIETANQESDSMSKKFSGREQASEERKSSDRASKYWSGRDKRKWR